MRFVLYIVSIIILFPFGVFSTAFGQSATSAAGGNATGTGGSVSYSVGQVVYTANNSTSGDVFQGVQQSYEILGLSGINTVSLVANSSVYPNPTTDVLFLNIEDFDVTDCVFILSDSNGKLLFQKSIIDKKTELEMSSFISGIYFVSVFENNKEIRTFKIVKL